MTTKLTLLIQALTPKERKGAIAWFNGVYFEKHPALRQLFNILNHLPNADFSEILKASFFKKTYPYKPYNDLKMRHLMADTLSHLEQYLVWRKVKADPVFLHQQLLSIYREKGLDKHYTGIQNTSHKLLNKHPFQDANFYYNRYALASDKVKYLESKNIRSKQDFLEQAMNDFEAYYLITKLKMSCEMLTYQGVVNIQYPIFLIDELIQNLPNHPLLHIPAIAIYFHILMTFKNENHVQHFEQLKQLLPQHLGSFPPPEKRDMYYFSLNYCARQINKGTAGFLEEIFDLYKLGLNTHILLENNELSPWNYKNIVTVGLRLKSFEWTHHFIQNFKEKLPTAFRKNAFTYNLAHYYFFKKEYGKVLPLLQKVAYEEVFYSLDARSLLLKSYYELGEFDALEALLDSFSQYLRRNKAITATRKTTYTNLIKLVKKLMNTSIHNREKLKQLQQKIQSTTQVADKQWLLKKIAEML